MVVAIGDDDRCVCGNLIEVCRERGAPREGSLLPASTDNPFVVWMLRQVVADDAEVVLAGPTGREVTTETLDTGLHRVNVRIDKSGEQQFSGEVHHTSVGGGTGLDLVRVKGDNDAILHANIRLHGHCCDPVEEVPVDENQI